MTPGRHPRRPTDDSWKAVLANAEQQLVAAQNALALADPAVNAKPVAAAAVIAAVGFGDALCIWRGDVVNAQEHARLPDLLHKLLGPAANAAQIARLRRILARKTAAQYGAVTWTYGAAEEYLTQVERFALWAREVLASPEAR